VLQIALRGGDVSEEKPEDARGARAGAVVAGVSLLSAGGFLLRGLKRL